MQLQYHLIAFQLTNQSWLWGKKKPQLTWNNESGSFQLVFIQRKILTFFNLDCWCKDTRFFFQANWQNTVNIRCSWYLQSSFLISRLSFRYPVKGKEMVTLWFKSSLCFSTFSDFWQLFLSLPAFLFLTFSLSLSDHVIHARLHVVWTRTKGIQSQWTLTETSVKLQQNGKTRAAVCGQGYRCCDVNLCPKNVWAELADY